MNLYLCWRSRWLPLEQVLCSQIDAAKLQLVCRISRNDLEKLWLLVFFAFVWPGALIDGSSCQSLGLRGKLYGGLMCLVLID